MNPQRMFWVGFGAFCLLVFCVAVLRGFYYATHRQFDEAAMMLVTAALMWWVGSAVASTLKANPEKPKPTGMIGPRHVFTAEEFEARKAAELRKPLP